MQEFKVNEFITVKLENKKSNIYVKGELFEQCKFLLLNIPTQDIDLYDEIESLDEIAEKLGWTENRQLGVDYELTPETEFFGHCSNLQAWAENNYDTCLVHRNLAFPLLKRLTNVGDSIANKVFKEEISKRLANGFPSVIKYLTEEGYDNYLSREEYLFSFLNIRDGEALLALEKIFGCQFQIKEDLDDFRDVDECDRVEIRNNNIVGITLSCDRLTNGIIELIGKLKYLKRLYLYVARLSMFENLLPSIKNLAELRIYNEEIKEIPKSIYSLTNLKTLIISLDKKKTREKRNFQIIKSLESRGVKIILI